jgi:hypothetical protein
MVSSHGSAETIIRRDRRLELWSNEGTGNPYHVRGGGGRVACMCPEGAIRYLAVRVVDAVVPGRRITS